MKIVNLPKNIKLIYKIKQIREALPQIPFSEVIALAKEEIRQEENGRNN
jgi:hypothetical protein